MRNNSWIWILVIVHAIAIVLLIPACTKSPFGCFTSTGPIEKTERQIAYFHSIQLNNNINLHLIPSNRNRLVLEAGSNLMAKIITEVNEDSMLVIQNNNTCNWVRNYDKPINVYLEFIDLKSLEYRSIGDVTNTDTLRLEKLQIDVYEGAGKIELALLTNQCTANLNYGTADIVLSGESGISFYYHLGAGLFDAGNFESDFVYLRNWSSNNMFVWAKTHLSVEIKGLGNVYYKGKPGIESTLPGQGKLIPTE